MSALEIANQTLSEKKISPKFLKLLVEKFSGTDFTMDSLKDDEDLAKFITKKRVKKAASSKSPEDLRDRAMEPICQSVCQARVWGGGYGGQCTRKHLETGCLCTLHQKEMDKSGNLWLGMFRTSRPEEPLHPNGKPHRWKITADGEFVEKKTSPKKKAEKAAPKKKAKKATPKKKAEKKPDSSVEELEKMLAEAKKKAAEEEAAEEEAAEEEVVEEEEEEEAQEEEVVEEEEALEVAADPETQTKVVDGVEYNYDPSTNMIIDPNDFTEMGEWDNEESCIDFTDEDVEEKHQQYQDECA
jgi:hypothetical protein